MDRTMAANDLAAAAASPACRAPIAGELATPDATAVGEAEWQDLFINALEANSFYAPSLLPAALHTFGVDGVDIAVLRDAMGMLVGLAPMTGARGYSRFPVPYRLTWMHEHCFFAAPLLRKGCEREALRALFSLADARGLFFRLRHLDAHGPVMTAAVDAAESEGRLVARSERYERAILRGGFTTETALQAAYSGKKRKELRRLRARLEEEGEVRLDRLDSAEDLPRWASEFLTLEASGWKGRDGSALANTENGTAFFEDAVRRAMKTGDLDFFKLSVGGRTIAMIANFGARGEVYSFKIAFDENYSRYSPGVMLEIEMMKYYEAQPGLKFIDSCAAANHPMINSLWRERRTVEALNVSRKDIFSKAAFRFLMALEKLSERRRARAAKAAAPEDKGGEDANL